MYYHNCFNTLCFLATVPQPDYSVAVRDDLLKPKKTKTLVFRMNVQSVILNHREESNFGVISLCLIDGHTGVISTWPLSPLRQLAVI